MGSLMDFMKAKDMLGKYNVHSVESTYVTTASQAVDFSNGKPIVIKVLSDKALHKTKSGVVELNLKTPQEIYAGFEKIVKNAAAYKPYKILAQKMIKSDNGVEVIVGGRNDVQFGPLILLGLGGIYVETFKDFSLRVCPITKYDAYQMMNELKSIDIIASDVKQKDELAKILVEVSKMMVENKIEELDLNPLLMNQGKYMAVDLRVII